MNTNRWLVVFIVAIILVLIAVIALAGIFGWLSSDGRFTLVDRHAMELISYSSLGR